LARVVIGAGAFTWVPETVAPLQQAGHQVEQIPLGPTASADRMAEVLSGAAGVVAGSEFYTSAVLDRLADLRIIARSGVGYDAIDVPAATERGILVATTPGGNDWAVADHAFALMLGLCHNIASNDRTSKAGQWKRPVGVDLWRKTIGIVGLGRTGKGVARRAQGFGMTILANEPAPDREFVAAHNIELVPLDDLMRRSDFVTLHLPSSAETYHLVDEERLSLLRPTAYLINTARGPLVDEAALEKALDEGRLAGAGLDVRETEPPTDTRFSRFDNVILTDHVAGVTQESVYAMSLLACQSIADTLAGREPHGLVNPEAWAHRRG
jgi:phosphoglycerate dehydrogenase-like enzyme